MASSPTTRNRLLKQGTGDNTNTWGDQQSSGDFDMIDLALDGVLSLTVSGNVSLSTANFVDDQARRRAIKIAAASSAAATITIPAVEKWYLVWNVSAFDQIIASSGGGTSVTVKAGEVVPVICDATNVARLTLVIDTSALTLTGALNMSGNKVTNIANGSSAQDAVGYAQMNSAISSAAFSMGSFGVPIVPGNAGQFLTNNGSTASWASSSTLTFTFGGVQASGAAGTARGLTMQTAASNRWAIVAGSAAEGGGNAGSDLNVNRFDDTGAYIDTPLSINRATGVVTANGQNLSKLRIRRLFANKDLI